ncbi:hypothetical protein BKI52_00425 [marine bacterium AO1-C]|nr:hypothetical protein BKI52_00425 [marine bacterium AO1-C]
MRKSFLGILTVLGIMFLASCQNKNEVSPTLSEGLVEAIAPADLPALVQAAVARDFSGQSITAAEKVTGSEGSVMYDVSVDSGETSSYNPEGGKCNKVELTEIPQAIQDYVAANYTGANIQKAAQITTKDGTVKIIVKLDIKKGLSFDEAGNFLGEKKGRKKRK